MRAAKRHGSHRAGLWTLKSHATITRTCYRFKTLVFQPWRFARDRSARRARWVRPDRPGHLSGRHPARAVPRTAPNRSGVVGGADAGIPSRLRRHERVLGCQQACRRLCRVAEQQGLLEPGARRDHPVRPGHDARAGRTAERHADQPGSAGPHQDPPDHQPWLHAALDQRDARRARGARERDRRRRHRQGLR